MIKLDVEGAERSVLDGAEKLLSRDGTAVLCCTYHRQNDAVELDAYLRERGFKTEFSDGYMLFTHDKKLRPPYFRKGLIRAEKQ